MAQRSSPYISILPHNIAQIENNILLRVVTLNDKAILVAFQFNIAHSDYRYGLVLDTAGISISQLIDASGNINGRAVFGGLNNIPKRLAVLQSRLCAVVPEDSVALLDGATAQASPVSSFAAT